VRDVDLSQGFQIENPQVFVPWGISEVELVDLVPLAPHHVTTGYYVIDCTSLSGLSHALGFHFRPREDGKLRTLEFFRRSYLDMHRSFDEFQRHLEETFGPPASESDPYEGMPHYTWKVGKATIRHYVFDRFGPEEHVDITHP
jgi:hypothetical protein